MSAPAAVWIFLAIVWGTTWLAVHVGLETLPPLSFAGVRFLIASGALFLALLARGARLPRSWPEWRLIIQTGFLAFGVAYALQFWGQQYVASGLAAVLFATVPLCTLILAHFALPDEPLTRNKLMGVIVGLLGVVIIFSNQLQGDGGMAAVACLGFLVASFSMAAAQVLIKSRGTRIDAMVLASTQMAVGGVLLMTMAFVVEGNPLRLSWSAPAVGAILYLALVGSATAFLLFYWLLKRMQVTRVSAMMLVHPVVALGLGTAFLDETLDWRAAFGALTILVGVSLILRRGSGRRRRSARSSQPTVREARRWRRRMSLVNSE